MYLEVWWFWFYEMVLHRTSPIVQKSTLIFNTQFSSEGTGHWKLNTKHWTLNTGHWTLHIKQFTLQTAHCIPCTTHFTLLTVHYTMQYKFWDLVTGHYSLRSFLPQMLFIFPWPQGPHYPLDPDDLRVRQQCKGEGGQLGQVPATGQGKQRNVEKLYK